MNKIDRKGGTKAGQDHARPPHAVTPADRRGHPTRSAAAGRRRKDAIRQGQNANGAQSSRGEGKAYQGGEPAPEWIRFFRICLALASTMKENPKERAGP